MFEFGKKILSNTVTTRDGLGAGISNRAITATLYVSPDGDGTDGSTWTKAYTTIQSALDVASTDANDCTLILIAPHDTFYDIDTTGDPTWACNVELKGSHRVWAAVRNEHASATSILKFTGKASVGDLLIEQTGTVNGLIFTSSGWRVRHCEFNSEALTGAATSVHADGSGVQVASGIMQDAQFQGHVSYTKGLHLENARIHEMSNLFFHRCLVGIHFSNAGTDENSFHKIDIGDCALGIDIDAGNEQHFDDLNFHHNTRNIDDEVGDTVWRSVHGEFPVYIYPDDFTGITIASHASADTWGTLTELVAAGAIDNPFRVVGVQLRPAVSQESRVRFTGDAGTVYYNDIMFDANKQQGSGVPSDTEFIFNADTKIEAAAKVIGGGPDNITLWLEIQEI